MAARRRLTRREITLLSVLAAATLVVLYLYSGGPTGRSSASATGSDPQAGLGEAPLVRMAMLTKEAEPYDPNGRDLFKYADRPLTWAEREARRRAEEERQRRLREEAERRRLAAEARAKREEVKVQQTVAQRTPTAQPPRVRFKYLGYFGPKDDKIAVFEDGEELLLARTGEVVDEDFLVKEINYQVVVIGYTKEEFKSRTTELSMANVN